MYQVSNSFLQAMDDISRTLTVEVEISGVSYPTDAIIRFDLERGAFDNAVFTIGQTTANVLTLEVFTTPTIQTGDEIKLFTSLLVGETYERVPLGVYYVDSARVNKEKMTLTCYDKMVTLIDEYTPSANHTTLAALFEDVLSQIGMTYDGVFHDAPIKAPLYGYTYRETLGFIASLNGGNMSINRAGHLEIQRFKAVERAIPAKACFSFDVKESYHVSRVFCQFGDVGITRGDSGGQCVAFENPYVTEQNIDVIYNQLNGLSFTAATLNYRGDLTLDPGDVFQFTDYKGDIYPLMCGRNKLTFNGGLSGQLDSIGESEKANTYTELQLKYKKNITKLTAELGKIQGVVQEIEQSHDGLEERIEKAELEITADAIKSKVENLFVSKDEMNGLVTEEQLQSAIIQSTDSITAQVSTKINNAVDNIKVGATNLWVISDLVDGSVNSSGDINESSFSIKSRSVTNILPPFDTWTQETGLTVSSISDYDITFTSPSTWTGIYLWGSTIISDGDTITIGVDSISDNAEFVIADSTGATIAYIDSSTTSSSVTVSGASPFDIYITSSDTNQVTVTGAYVYIGESGGGDSSVSSGATYVQLDNRLVGYKQATSEIVDSSATIVSTASALTSAISNATAGSIIYVRSGNYTVSGGLTISKAGTSSKYITIKNYPNETPVLTGTGVTFTSSCKYINFEGFVIKDMVDLDWGTCVHVSGGASYINLRNLEITNIKCRPFSSSSSNGCNPLVLYGDSSNSINNILIENCYVHDCDTGWSEAITLNGNVTDCIVRNCTVDNNKNIGIDLAGNFSWTGTVGDSNNQTRNCIIENNLVMNCQSPYATSAGLYCDGGRDNTFRYNIIYNCQCGIELGAEEPGATVQNFHVYGNLIIDSGRSIGVGGYQTTSAIHQNTWIYNNTFICGNNNEENYGLYLERTNNLYFVNNIVYGASGTKLYATSGEATNVTLNGNCWYNGTAPSADSNKITTNPLFINNNGSYDGNYNLQATSPCINKGQAVSDTTLCGTVDINNNSRVQGDSIDIGAFEYIEGSSSGGDTGDNGGSGSQYKARQTLIGTNGATGLVYQVWNEKQITNSSNANRVAFFDANRNFLSCVTVSKLSGDKYQSQYITIPSGVSYVRLGAICGNSDTGYDDAIKIKFELGNKPTDYSLAPEDVESEFTILQSETKTLKESVTSLQLGNDSISASVKSLQETVTSTANGLANDIASIQNQVNLTMTSDDVKIEIQKEMSKGANKVSTSTGFTFDDNGLKVSKSDSEMATQITEDGMTVYRNDEAVLTANNQGVDAKNLRATTYLIIGSNSRMEDFTCNNDKRTAMFWIGD